MIKINIEGQKDISIYKADKKLLTIIQEFQHHKLS